MREQHGLCKDFLVAIGLKKEKKGRDVVYEIREMKYKAKREEGKEEEGNDGVENRRVEGKGGDGLREIWIGKCIEIKDLKKNKCYGGRKGKGEVKE
ncbi:hypothetical protein NC653_028653 [Populus alba x Populus x berolinensis]|uniref:Uncharacterized protein n=1 Tax=Populus alba x Populus x berolinensis TaxID=444605 RepID=A0AAD6Q3M3_9ROSI|nr:hypothetical protein NC653_028653 [Populus alba x Populus x berolinensis]